MSLNVAGSSIDRSLDAINRYGRAIDNNNESINIKSCANNKFIPSRDSIDRNSLPIDRNELASDIKTVTLI